MPIELSEISDEDDVLPGVERRRMGFIFMYDDGRWVASEGKTCVTGEGVFDGLDRDVSWLINQDFQSVKVLQDTHPDMSLKISSWMRIGIDEMASEWGITDKSDPQSAQTLAAVLDRIYEISTKTILNSHYAQNKNPNTIINSIDNSPSLATGLRKIYEKEMDKTVPSDAKVRKRVTEALVFGAYVPGENFTSEDEVRLTFQIPRLSHALRVSSRDVPAQGKWQKANLPTDTDLKDHLDELIKLDLPVFVVGNPQKKANADQFLESLIKPNTKSIKRMSYSLDEVRQLAPYYDFKDYSVMVGPGWRRSTVSKVLAGLVQECGGRDVASTSWSAGIAAENILCGGFRKIGAGDALPPECIWLTVGDRLEMWKAFNTLSNYGATLITAYAGRIDVKIPSDPEMITMLLNAAWEAGLVLPINHVFKLLEMGIEIPSDISSFGGAQEDMILAQVTHQAQRNAMWVLDGIQSLDQDKKKQSFNDILG